MRLAIATTYDELAYKIASGRREWPNRDPIGIQGGVNLYAFVANGPVNSVDPEGLDAYGNPVPPVINVDLNTGLGTDPGGAFLGLSASPTGAVVLNGIASLNPIYAILQGALFIGSFGWSYVTQDDTQGDAKARHDHVGLVLATASFIPGEVLLKDVVTVVKDGKTLVNETYIEVQLAAGGTYVLRDPVTGAVVRTGRTADLLRREAEHARSLATKEYTFETVHRTDAYAEQRGLEQLLQQQNPNAPLNKINAISPTNPNRQTYLDAARKYLDATTRQ